MGNSSPLIRCACELVRGDPDQLLHWQKEGAELVLIFRARVRTIPFAEVAVALGAGEASPDRAVKR